MSDTQEAAPTLAAETPAPQETQEIHQQADPVQEMPQEGAEAENRPKPPGWVKPAIDRLTREKHEAHREAELRRREAEQLRRELDMYRAAAPAGEGAPQPSQPRPEPMTEDVVERKAREMLEREKVDARRQTLIDSGVKELGEQAWNEKTAIVANLGATDSPAFMRAIVTVPEGHKVVAALAEQPDRVMSLLRMDGVEMAAELGRMAAEITSAKPAQRKISAAPPPGQPVGGRQVAEPSLYDKSLSMKEWAALYDKQEAAKRRRA